jgi:uncharacterized damage-inducible protein DinB
MAPESGPGVGVNVCVLHLLPVSFMQAPSPTANHYLEPMTNENPATAVAAAMSALWTAELPATMRVISAVRDDQRDYRPHPRSRSSWELLLHIATSDLWFLQCAERGTFHFDQDAAKQAESKFGSAAEIAASYEKAIPQALERLRAMPADKLAEEVDFFGMMRMSRASWIGFALNHSVHHRGQLSAYLRPMGCRVPDIYGPSGDAEGQEPAA